MFGGARDRRQAFGDIREEEEPDPKDMYRFRTTAYHNSQQQQAVQGQGGREEQTLPRQESGDSADRTPSAKAKVLPWVEGVEEGTIPDGMFGPYDSLPPTRMPTMHESQPRQHHPFAFTAPLADTIDIPPAVPSKDGSRRKESPKKAALTSSPRQRPASPTRSAPHPLPANTSTSDPVQKVPTPRSRTDVSRKPVPAAHIAELAQPVTHIPAHSAQPVPQMTTHGKGHHEHPFSHTDAARAQAEAMELARAQALAQLQHVDAQGTSTDEMPAGLARAMGSLGMDPAQMQRGQGPAGARGTFETGTSGPSFGHLYHDGAQPTSTRQSAQRQYAQQLALAQMQAQGYTGEVGDDGPESHAMMRELVGPGQEAASFVRVPFGVPLNMQLPRPMMLMRTGTGMGMGIGISPLGMGMGMMSPGAEMSLHGLGQSLYGLPKQAEGKMDNRSAYVETVEDEESPTNRTHAKTKTHKTTVPPTVRTEKTNEQMAHQSTKSTMGGLPKGFDPEIYPPPAVSHRTAGAATPKGKSKAATKTHHRDSSPGTPPLDVRSKTGKSTRPPVSAAHKSRKAPSESRSALGATLAVLEAQQAGQRSLGVRSAADSQSQVDGISIASNDRTGDDRSSADSDRTYRPPPSVAPTTASNIKRLVSNSGVHDEQLCQLLDAAKLNLIGSEAKKALQRAARARVIELRDARETQAQMKAALEASEKAARSKDSAKERSIEAASATTAPPASIKSKIDAAVPAPQPPSVAASRQTRSNANTVRQADVDGRTDVSPKTKKQGQHTAQTAASRTTTAAAQGVAMPMSNLAQLQSMQMMQGGESDPYGTPRWAKDLRDKMSLLDERMTEMQRQADNRQTLDSAVTPSGEGLSPALLQELIYGGFAQPQMSYFALPGMPAGMSAQGAHIEAHDSPHSTKFREVPPSTKHHAQSGGDVTLTWGSEVELPSGTGSPTKLAQGTGATSTIAPRGPIINVHPPTESNARTRAASIPSRTDPRTPAAHTMQLQQDEPGTGITGMAEVDKSLPDTPETEKAPLQYNSASEAGVPGVDGRVDTSSPLSVERARGAVPSIAQTMPQSGYGGYPYEQASTTQAPSAMPRAYETTVRDGTMQDSATADTLPTPTGHYPAVLGAPIPVPATAQMPSMAPSRAPVGTQQPFTPMTEQQSAMTADAVTAPTHITRPSLYSQAPPTQYQEAQAQARPQQQQQTPRTQYTQAASPRGKARDIIRVREVQEDTSSKDSLEPWDAITQRLYQWAMVWEEDSFQKALESLALGKQAEGLALTVFMMMVYKRLVAHHMTSSPVQVCDKLFVPPIMAEAINQAVHNKQFDSAGAMLEDLWYPYGMKNPPRVVIALAKHRKDADKWTAHRFDLSSGNLTSYAVTSEEQNLPDGRPFMWWYALRSAWPEYNIPDPESLKQRVEYVKTDPEKSGDNSLKAMNYARNLLLPELGRDLTKLRETVWNEVKRLSNKKKAGHLIIDAEHRHHAHA